MKLQGSLSEREDRRELLVDEPNEFTLEFVIRADEADVDLLEEGHIGKFLIVGKDLEVEGLVCLPVSKGLGDIFLNDVNNLTAIFGVDLYQVSLEGKETGLVHSFFH